MSFLSPAPPLGGLSPPHGAFQGHAAHVIEWSITLSPKGSLGACTPKVFPHSSMPLSRRTATQERTLEAVSCSARLCQKSIFRKHGLTKSMGCKAHMLRKRGFDTVWRLVRHSALVRTPGLPPTFLLQGHSLQTHSRLSGYLQTQDRRQATDQATPVPPLPLQQVV